MTRILWLSCLLLAAVANTGCVERKFLVASEPPGAMLYVNGEQVGPTPHDVYFTYYGKYHLTLVLDGYETLQVDQCIPSPWYEYPLVDFFSENIYPFKIRDLRTFTYGLQSVQSVRPEDVLNRGELLRTKGQSVVPLPGAQPPKPKPAPPPPPAATLPPDSVAPPTLGAPRPIPPGT